MTDHYLAYCEAQVRELRAERDRLAAENEALRATIERVRGVYADWQHQSRILVSHGIRYDLDVTAATIRLGRALDGGAE